jgi:hypothetical protein
MGKLMNRCILDPIDSSVLTIPADDSRGDPPEADDLAPKPRLTRSANATADNPAVGPI